MPRRTIAWRDSEEPRFGIKHNGDLMVREWLYQHPDVGVAIFDTFAKSRTPPTGQGSAYDQDYDAAKQETAARLTTHDRKLHPVELITRAPASLRTARRHAPYAD